MIPKIIHYCWFGGSPLPAIAQKCIDSWKKYCPDYEIVEWNESNYDINSNDYVREAYSNKKWAFVTDVVRLYVLTKYGGIYMDTDVEVIKPLDWLLQFEAVSGFESDKYVPTGLMACEKGNPLFLEFLSEYDNIHFIRKDGSLNMTTNVIRITNACVKYGLDRKKPDIIQNINGFVLLPKEYLCPMNNETGELQITDNTLTIHWFSGSWRSEKQREAHNTAKGIRKRFPGKMGLFIGMFYEYLVSGIETYERGGIKAVISEIKRIVVQIVVQKPF